ncbi:hypothetical protein BaRGS_00030684 [Batillaria attramentaria]|uniref:Uncharacterized protein n=1 Tax=Batillaria attramentaria TaxID=370345 RepID=A0ABD0JU92_9CAEN
MGNNGGNSTAFQRHKHKKRLSHLTAKGIIEATLARLSKHAQEDWGYPHGITMETTDADSKNLHTTSDAVKYHHVQDNEAGLVGQEGFSGGHTWIHGYTRDTDHTGSAPTVP